MTGQTLGFTANTISYSTKSRVKGAVSQEQQNCFGAYKRHRQIPTLGKAMEIREYFAKELHL